MRIPKRPFAMVAAVALAFGLIGEARAGTVTAGSYTLTSPDYPLSAPGLASCEPWEESTAKSITIGGVEVGSTVQVTFVTSAPFSGPPTFTAPATVVRWVFSTR